MRASSVSLAGQPAKVGGLVTKTFGWIVFTVGMLAAFMLYTLFHWLFPTGPIDMLTSVPVAVVTLAIFVGAQLGGKSLSAHGTKVAQSTREQAVFTLAQNRKGRLHVRDTAVALGLSIKDTDALLTEMAKRFSDQMTVDIEESGEIVFCFSRIDLEHRMRLADPKLRVVASDDLLRESFESFVEAESERVQKH
jgi:hypothetical protein